MISLTPLFSGSSGNCTLVESATGAVLVDAGVSGRRIETALEEKGKSMQSVSAILITHEHNDHILSAGTLSRKYHLPVYASRGTWETMHSTIGTVYTIRSFTEGVRFALAGMEVEAFSLPHDAAEPVGYNFYADTQKITVATDIGKMDEGLFLYLAGSDTILLESNYDTKMLQNGRYPYSLKQRIAGEYGHLSNGEAAAICARLVSLGTKRIILGHLSAENNTPSLAYAAAKEQIEACGVHVDTDMQLAVAARG